jgi:hypothetical protein
MFLHLNIFLTLKISIYYWLCVSLWQSKSIELDHVKPSLVHEVAVTIRVTQKELVLQDFRVLFYKENNLS